MDKNNSSVAGSLKVSGDVIIKIAETAASEIEGVAVTSTNKLMVMKNAPIVSKLISPIRVKIGSESAEINVSIITEIGYKAYEVAKAVQENIKSSVQNMTGIAVSKVNVNVVGVTSAVK